MNGASGPHIRACCFPISSAVCLCHLAQKHWLEYKAAERYCGTKVPVEEEEMEEEDERRVEGWFSTELLVVSLQHGREARIIQC